MRSTVRAALSQVGLLEVIRQTRDAVASLAWLQHNRRFLRRGGGDGLPLPPARLRNLTTASPSVAWFIQSGRAAADSIRELLDRHGVPLAKTTAILDFGCGCGRVIRHWVDAPGAVHGCDYNTHLVDWCHEYLPFGLFETNELTPPLPYDTGSFNLVYALSVFTHLPQPLQQQWIGEMARILTPTGYLLVSTHGESCLDTLTAAERDRFHAGELVVHHDEEAGSNRCGVFCSEDGVRRQFEPSFVMRDFLPNGARGNPPQDLVLLQAVVPQPNMPSPP